MIPDSSSLLVMPVYALLEVRDVKAGQECSEFVTVAAVQVPAGLQELLPALPVLTAPGNELTERM